MEKNLLIDSGISQEKPLYILEQLTGLEGPDWGPVMNSLIDAIYPYMFLEHLLCVELHFDRGTQKGTPHIPALLELLTPQTQCGNEAHEASGWQEGQGTQVGGGRGGRR